MAAPVNTVAPVVSGTETVGSILSCTTGTWTGGAQSYTYQWQRSNGELSNIAGATLNQYTIISADTDHILQCVVTATNNQAQSASATSNATSTILDDWFIPEDGTGLEDSNSLCTVEYANGYHATRAHAEWSLLSSNQKKSLLIQATDHIEQEYISRFQGSRTFPLQSLSWPRYGVIVDGIDLSTEIVPNRLKDAAAELAWRALGSELAPDIEPTGNVISESVEGVVSIQYSDRAIPRTVVFRAVDNLLRPLCKNSNMFNPVVSRG